MRYLFLLLLMVGCADKGEWYIHFVDGSEIRITQPSRTDPKNNCASRMYIVPTEHILFSSTADAIKAKGIKSDGYTYRKGNGLRWVKYCE